MKKTLVNYLFLACAVAAAGCAGASVRQKSASAPITAARPTQIVVYPFAVDPNEVTLNQSIFQRAYRSMSGEDQSAQQHQLASDTAQSVCQSVVTALQQKGYSAVCQARGTAVSGDNVLVVDGEFTDISEGNRLRRLVIGFGAGASALDTSVHMYQRANQSSRQVLDFTTHADSGQMPGAAVLGPAGAAAGGSAAGVAGANVAAGGVKTYRSATAFLADKTAEQIVTTMTNYFAQQGWSS
jgi:uncharacterized protein (UPF0297 family)